MAQFSTGLGLAVLGGCILGAAAISSPRFSDAAFAQGTGADRRVVSASVTVSPTNQANEINVWAYRIWSDNSIDMRFLGRSYTYSGGIGPSASWSQSHPDPNYPNSPQLGTWRTVDNGTSGFRPLTDVDMSGETDAGDISQVLLDFNTSSDDLPPPPIDCTINAPR